MAMSAESKEVLADLMRHWSLASAPDIEKSWLFEEIGWVLQRLGAWVECKKM
jgi:hypothetical protein